MTRIVYKGRTSGKDRVEVTWVTKSTCVKPVDARITVHVINQSNQASPVTVSFTLPASNATSSFIVPATTIVDVPVVGTAPITRISASVTDTGRSTDTLTGTKSGNF